MYLSYLFLAIAILSEVTATSTLKATNGFTRLWPTIVVGVCYLNSFYFLTLALRHISVGIVYALWSGFGIILVTLAGRLFYKQILDLPSIAGISLIIAGVLIINLFSKSVLR